MYLFSGITPLGAVLGTFTLLAVCKMATDVVFNDPDNFNDAVLMIFVGSMLSAGLLFR
jgi:hypothetical protein